MLQALQQNLQLSPEQRGFHPGENVIWCGVAGKVVKAVKGKVYVKFVNHLIVSFFSDGRYYEWHLEPSLKLCTEEELNRQALENYKGRH